MKAKRVLRESMGVRTLQFATIADNSNKVYTVEVDTDSKQYTLNKRPATVDFVRIHKKEYDKLIARLKWIGYKDVGGTASTTAIKNEAIDSHSDNDNEGMRRCEWCDEFYDESELYDTDFGKICFSCRKAIESKEGLIDESYMVEGKNVHTMTKAEAEEAYAKTRAELSQVMKKKPGSNHAKDLQQRIIKLQRRLQQIKQKGDGTVTESLLAEKQWCKSVDKTIAMKFRDAITSDNIRTMREVIEPTNALLDWLSTYEPRARLDDEIDSIRDDLSLINPDASPDDLFSESDDFVSYEDDDDWDEDEQTNEDYFNYVLSEVYDLFDYYDIWIPTSIG